MDLIIAIIIGAILWVLYHKLFHVVYFGGTFYQIISELFTCLVLGWVITLLGAKLFGWFFVFLINAIAFIIKLIGYGLIIATIIFCIWAIYKIIKSIVIHIKKKNGTYVEKTDDHVETAPDEVIVENTVQEQNAENAEE